MAPPTLCFTCGKKLSNIYEKYQEILKKTRGDNESLFEELTKLGVKNYCCKMHLISSLNYIDSVQ